MGRKTSFDDHLSIIENGSTTKVASLNQRGSILSKIAEELQAVEEGAPAEAPAEEAAPMAAPMAAPAPTAEGEVTPAASSVAGANPAVVGATDAVAAPQLALSGANPVEAMQGEIPAPTKPNEGVVISAADGDVTDANQLHKTEAAVIAALGGEEAAMKTAAQAEIIGTMIAESFVENIEKVAEDEEYTDALVLLKEAGLLDAYDILDDVDEYEKTASLETDGLEKIANNEALSHDDIISAGYQVAAILEKEAADEEFEENIKLAYEAGIQDAVDYLIATQEDVEEDEAVKQAMQDDEVMAAVQILQAKGLL